MKKEVFVILAIVLVAFLTIFFSGDPQKLINGNMSGVVVTASCA